MRARLVCMNKDLRKALGLHLWQVFDIKEIQILTTRHTYKRETKYIICNYEKASLKEIKFYWYEVELIE